MACIAAPTPDCLDLDGLTLQEQLLLLIEKHGPTTRGALAFWTGTNKHRPQGYPALDRALGRGLFLLHAGKYRLSNAGVNALAALRVRLRKEAP